MNRRVLFILFVVLALAQIAVPVWAILRMEMPLREGESFRFKMDAHDPYDPVRGRYLALRFEERSAPVPEGVSLRSGQSVYASIEQEPDDFSMSPRRDILKRIGVSGASGPSSNLRLAAVSLFKFW